MISFNQDIATALDRAIVKITDKFLEPPIMITISNSDSVIGTLGNFSASTGKAKSRKTFNVISLVAAALSGKQILQYKVKVPINRPLVLYCDTEQSRFHCHRLISRVYKLINYPTTEVHENLKFISLREYPTKERISIIEYALSKYAGKICLVIIDGIRDLVYDINNATEATEITGKLMKWSQELNIHEYSDNQQIRTNNLDFIIPYLLLFSRMFSVHHVPGKVPGVLFPYIPEELRFRYEIKIQQGYHCFYTNYTNVDIKINL